MQRYYFEIKIDGALIADDRGRDCHDLADAHAHAAKIVADCVRFCPPEPTGERGRIAVVDEAGLDRCRSAVRAAGDVRRASGDEREGVRDERLP